MTWKHVAIIAACLAAVIACGFRSSCAAVLPSIVTLATFICGGAIGDARSPGAGMAGTLTVRKEPPPPGTP